MQFIPLILLVVVLVVWYKQYENSFFKKPTNYPDFSKINRENKPIFIAFGDSLTQGNMSADWLEKLAESRAELQIFNAGMNADLTYTLLNRIEDITICKPQIISLLIGSNDVMATLSPARMKRYYELGKITEDAYFEGFESNYRKIVEIILAETDAKILAVSLPPITENFDFIGNEKAEKYSQTIKNIANEYGLTYVPFRERLVENMPKVNEQLEDFDQSVLLLRKAAIKKNFLGQSWNEISRSRKAKYLTDNIHLNDDAAAILVELLNNEIDKLLKN
jgi:lysophospholipase L1-like esterase